MRGYGEGVSGRRIVRWAVRCMLVTYAGETSQTCPGSKVSWHMGDTVQVMPRSEMMFARRPTPLEGRISGDRGVGD